MKRPYLYTFLSLLCLFTFHTSWAYERHASPAIHFAPSFAALFERPQHYQQHYYVDINAPAQGTGSKTKPFNNLKHALSHARPGSYFHILPGRYKGVGVLQNIQGLADAPIAIVGEGEVIIDAQHDGSGLALVDARYVLIDGLTIMHTGIHGLSLDDGGDYRTPGGHVVIRNLHFKQIGQGKNHDCLKMSGIDHFYIYHNQFEGCNRGEGIDMVGCHHGVITGNLFQDMPGTAVQTKGGSRHILIQGNHFKNIAKHAINAGGSTGLDYFRPAKTDYEAKEIFIHANFIERSGLAAVGFYACHQCTFSHNTLIEPQLHIIHFMSFKSQRHNVNSQFINNAIHYKQRDMNNRGFIKFDPALPPTMQFTFANNYWHMLDIDIFKRFFIITAPLQETNAIYSVIPLLDQHYRPISKERLLADNMQAHFKPKYDFDGQPYKLPLNIGALVAPEAEIDLLNSNNKM